MANIATINRKLRTIEKRIEDIDKMAWYMKGLLLAEIQYTKLYKEKYKSFENYLEKRWDFDRHRGYHLINAAKTYQILEQNIPKSVDGNTENVNTLLPKNEYQIRPLMKLENDSERVYVWNHLVEEGIKPTNENVKREVNYFIDHPIDVEIIEVEEILFADDIVNKKQSDIEKRKQEYTEATKRSIEDNKPTVYVADCLEHMDKMIKKSVDLLITDPPYSTDVEDIGSFAKEWVPRALDLIKDDGRAYICIGAYPEEIKAYMDVLLDQDRFIVDNPLVWTYRNTLGVTPKMKYNLNYQLIIHLYTEDSGDLDTSITNEMFSVQDINAPDGRQGDRYHTWQKPDELAMRLIAHSTNENDVIFDPFTCTGTFLIAGAKFGRKAIGTEINKDNALIAEERGCCVLY